MLLLFNQTLRIMCKGLSLFAYILSRTKAIVKSISISLPHKMLQNTVRMLLQDNRNINYFVR